MFASLLLISVAFLNTKTNILNTDFSNTDLVEINTCSNDLRDLSEYIKFSIDICPMRRELFKIDDTDLHTILSYLSDRLEENMNNCPCIGPCTQIECN
jgi:hypothetical protein